MGFRFGHDSGIVDLVRDFAAITHPGNVRDQNEDSFCADGDLGLWIVADGVGGHVGGEVASRLACDTITQQVRGGAHLDQAVRAAHQRVLQEISRRENDAGGSDVPDGANNMGTTVVALRRLDPVGESYDLVWAGDSRAYLWNGALKQLTKDHSFVGELVAKGVLTPAQAARHPERHVITQSVGVSAHVSLDLDQLQCTLAPHDQLLLCSDGLTDELSEAEIALAMQQHASVQDQAEGLLAAALDAGGRDNITALVIGPEPSSTVHPDVQSGVHATADATLSWRQWSVALMLLLLVMVVFGLLG